MLCCDGAQLYTLLYYGLVPSRLTYRGIICSFIPDTFPLHQAMPGPSGKASDFDDLLPMPVMKDNGSCGYAFGFRIKPIIYMRAVF